jgi:hypothetical protein
MAMTLFAKDVLQASEFLALVLGTQGLTWFLLIQR